MCVCGPARLCKRRVARCNIVTQLRRVAVSLRVRRASGAGGGRRGVNLGERIAQLRVKGGMAALPRVTRRGCLSGFGVQLREALTIFVERSAERGRRVSQCLHARLR